MALEDRAGAFLERAAQPRAQSAHAAALVHVAHEVRNSLRAEFADENPDIGEAAKQIIEDQRG